MLVKYNTIIITITIPESDSFVLSLTRKLLNRLSNKIHEVLLLVFTWFKSVIRSISQCKYQYNKKKSIIMHSYLRIYCIIKYTFLMNMMFYEI